MSAFNSLKTKVLLFILVATLTPIIVISFLVYNSSKNTILNTRKAILESIQYAQKTNISNYLVGVINTTEALQFSDMVSGMNIDSLTQNKLSPEYKTTKRELDGFLRIIQRKERYSDIFILDNEGVVVYSSDPSYSWNYVGKNLSFIYPFSFSPTSRKIQFSKIFPDMSKDTYYNFLTLAPLIRDDDKKTGYVAIEQSMIPIYKIMDFDLNLTNTGESLLVSQKQNDFFLESPLQHHSNVKINAQIDIQPLSENIAKINGEEVLYVSSIIPELNWTLITKIDINEVLAEIVKLRNLTFVIVFIMVLIALIFSYVITSYLTGPIIKLADFAKKIANQDFGLAIDAKLLERKDEIGMLSNAFHNMQLSLNAYYQALNIKIDELEEANTKIHQSIRYASRIQSSLLPNVQKIETVFSDSFFIWKPRDIVGGDTYSLIKVKDGFILALVDCTGHSVPGAFLTMLFASLFTQVVISETTYEPDIILSRLNVLMKHLLKQDHKEALSDDGLDAAICYIKPGDKKLIFAGAKLPLICIDNEQINVIEGDKCSVGYLRTPMDAQYSRHELDFGADTCFYMTTDGLLDQLSGGDRPLPFGKKRFYKQMLQEHRQPMAQQKETLLVVLEQHKGTYIQLDDISVIGFKIRL